LALPGQIDTLLWKERPYYTIHPTRLLARPDAGGELLHVLPERSKLIREARVGYWVKVKYDGFEGWTKAENLRIANASEVQGQYAVVAQMFVEDTFPEDNPFAKILAYLVGVGFFVALARMQRSGKSLLQSFAANRIPLMFALNVACSAFYFEVRNRPQLLLMSDTERLAIAAAAVAFTTATWCLVDAVAGAAGTAPRNQESSVRRIELPTQRDARPTRQAVASGYTPINIYVSSNRNQTLRASSRLRR
jgi:hypothetical protein